ELVKSGQWAGWHPDLLLGLELRGRTLGLFGAGRIGQAVGRRAVPFGMRTLYAARNQRPEFERETGALRVEFSQLLRDSDVLSLHAPAVPESKGVINADTLRQMKPGAILINTAHGALIREEAPALLQMGEGLGERVKREVRNAAALSHQTGREPRSARVRRPSDAATSGTRCWTPCGRPRWANTRCSQCWRAG